MKIFNHFQQTGSREQEASQESSIKAWRTLRLRLSGKKRNQWSRRSEKQSSATLVTCCIGSVMCKPSERSGRRRLRILPASPSSESAKWGDYLDKCSLGSQLCGRVWGCSPMTGLISSSSLLVSVCSKPSVMAQCSTTPLSSHPNSPMKTMLHIFPELHEWTLAEGGHRWEGVGLVQLPVYLILCTQHHHPALSNGWVQIGISQDHSKLILCPAWQLSLQQLEAGFPKNCLNLLE